MTRTAYAIVKYDKSSGIVDLNGANVQSTIDSVTGVGNGISVTDAFNTRYDSLHIYINNTAATAKNVSLLPGDFANSIQGQLSISIPASGLYEIKVNQPDRFQKKDGSLVLEFDTGMTGKVAVIAEATNL